MPSPDADYAKRTLRDRLGTPGRADPVICWLAVYCVLAGVTLFVATSGWVTAFIAGHVLGAGASALVLETI